MTDSTRPANWPHLWFGRTWSTRTARCVWTLSEEDLLRLYEALPAPADDVSTLDVERIVCEALNVEGVSHRKADRALQLLRRAGLIEYTGAPRRWRRVTP